jgi:hypothetical protein
LPWQTPYFWFGGCLCAEVSGMLDPTTHEDTEYFPIWGRG